MPEQTGAEEVHHHHSVHLLQGQLPAHLQPNQDENRAGHLSGVGAATPTKTQAKLPAEKVMKHQHSACATIKPYANAGSL